jgi:CHAT domain-containing protein/Tfp pilus assembly protein PilF
MTMLLYIRKASMSMIVVLSILCFTWSVASLKASEPIALDNLNKSISEFVARGNYKDALPSAESSVAIARDLKDRDALASSLARLANIYLHLGRFGDAEPLYKEALQIREEAVPSDPQAVANSLNDMGQLYYTLERYHEAADLYWKALGLWEHALPPDSAQIGEALNNLGATYRGLGRYEEAEPLLLRALAIQKKALGENHPDVALTLNNIGIVYLLQNRVAEAEPFVRQSLEMYQRLLPANHPKIADALNILGVLYFRRENYVEAELLFARASDIGERSLGLQHPDTLQYLGRLAQVREAQGNLSEAYDLYRKVALNYIARSDRAGGAIAKADAREDSGDNSAQQRVYLALVRVAQALTKVERRRGTSLIDEAFVTGQRVETSMAAAALSQMSVRFSAGTGPLIDLVRRRQELVAEYQALDRRLVAAYSAPDTLPDLAQEPQWQQQSAEVDRQIAEVDAQLAREFPKYPALANPKPLSIADTQKLLSPNEALLYVTFENQDVHRNDGQYAYAWVVTKGDVKFDKLSLPKKKAAEMAQTLRCGLDYSEWESLQGQIRCNLLLGGEAPDEDKQDPLPFSFAVAYDLYSSLIGPFREIIGDRQILVVPSGPLATLPFHLLVTKSPKVPVGRTFHDYREIIWLGRQRGVTVLPSVSSLGALRALTPGKSATDPYVGYGAPALNGNDRCATGVPQNVCPILNASGSMKARARPTKIVRRRSTSRGATFEEIFAPNALNDAESIRARIRTLCPLPDSAIELRCVARSLRLSEASIRVGEADTEAGIKALSQKGLLQNYRIVHFATHGILAGELQKGAEPALVFTPPKEPSDKDDDGLLTASEIAQLRMNADWIIMSACNTAGGDKPNADAFSGLARAFFFAGARALLVSHWPVYSDAAVFLIATTFNELKSRPQLTRTEAHRLAMIALMSDESDPSNLHPSVWAPFVVVGEGGR